MRDKKKITLYAREELIHRARGAVLWAVMKGAEHPRSLSDLFDTALERELARLVKELKPEGGEFPLVERGLPGGRPPNRPSFTRVPRQR